MPARKAKIIKSMKYICKPRLIPSVSFSFHHLTHLVSSFFNDSIAVSSYHIADTWVPNMIEVKREKRVPSNVRNSRNWKEINIRKIVKSTCSSDVSTNTQYTSWIWGVFERFKKILSFISNEKKIIDTKFDNIDKIGFYSWFDSSNRLFCIHDFK